MKYFLLSRKVSDKEWVLCRDNFFTFEDAYLDAYRCVDLVKEDCFFAIHTFSFESSGCFPKIEKLLDSCFTLHYDGSKFSCSDCLHWLSDNEKCGFHDMCVAFPSVGCSDFKKKES